MAKEKKPTDGTPKAPARSRAKKPAAAAVTSAAPVTQHMSPSQPKNFESAEEAVRRRAFELSQRRSANDGSPEDDWIRAEQEILGKHSA